MSLSSIQLEKHAIGGLILNPDIVSDVEGFLVERDFQADPHGIIWGCIRSSFLKNEKVDKVILSQQIRNLGVSFKDKLDIYDYIDSICFTQITPKATIQACQELVKLRVLRDLDDTCSKMKSHIKHSVNQDLHQTITEIDAIYGQKVATIETVNEPEELFFDIFDLIEETGKNPNNETGLVTPFAEFNRMYGGLRDGNVYAIASRPGQGKTTWLNHLAIETAKLNNIPVLILDTEMSTKEIKFRTAAGQTGVPLWYLETGNWRKNQGMVDKVRAKLKDLQGKHKIYHYHVGNKNVDEVAALIRRWFLSVVGRGNKCLVVYDYLKLTGEKLSNNWAEHQALGEKVDKFKRISEELRFPFFTAIQLNRSAENTGRQSANVVDDGAAIAISDRLQWFATYLAIFRRKTDDEIVLDTLESGTHKLIEIKARYQGKDAAGHQDMMLRTFPDGTRKYVRNYVNFSVENFAVEERGSLRDSIARQNAQFLVEGGGEEEQENRTL